LANLSPPCSPISAPSIPFPSSPCTQRATVMDGTPVFNLFRNDFPALKVLGFTRVLNSTSKVVVAAKARGFTLDAGVKEAQALGVAEADPSFDLDAWAFSRQPTVFLPIWWTLPNLLKPSQLAKLAASASRSAGSSNLEPRSAGSIERQRPISTLPGPTSTKRLMPRRPSSRTDSVQRTGFGIC